MNLSDLLRMTLREPQPSEIRLLEELALLQHYVDIQRLRFCDRLAFHIEASDEAASFYLPPLLLQPPGRERDSSWRLGTRPGGARHGPWANRG